MSEREKYEYRVVWRRGVTESDKRTMRFDGSPAPLPTEGKRVRRRKYARLETAESFMEFLIEGPADLPQEYGGARLIGNEPLAPMEMARIERRPVGEWEAIPDLKPWEAET